MIGPFNSKARFVKNVFCFCFYKPFRSRLATKFAKKFNFEKNSIGVLEKTQNLMLCSKLPKKLRKGHAKEFPTKKVIEKGVFDFLFWCAKVFGLYLSLDDFWHFFNGF
jgi:hypothetical protein